MAERTRELIEGERQLCEARKMELVGRLAEGIARDFNALLASIIGNADLIRRVAPGEQAAFKIAVEIGDAASRAVRLTEQLVAFSRTQTPTTEPVTGYAAGPAGEAEAAIAAAAPAPSVILLAEADAALRVSAAAILQEHGYTVHQASGCSEAIGIAGRLARVDLLLANAGMPEMTGVELAQWLCALHPQMKALFAAGDREDFAAPNGGRYPGVDFIRKPYTAGILSARVGEALRPSTNPFAGPI